MHKNQMLQRQLQEIEDNIVELSHELGYLEKQDESFKAQISEIQTQKASSMNKIAEMEENIAKICADETSSAKDNKHQNEFVEKVKNLKMMLSMLNAKEMEIKKVQEFSKASKAKATAQKAELMVVKANLEESIKKEETNQISVFFQKYIQVNVEQYQLKQNIGIPQHLFIPLKCPYKIIENNKNQCKTY